MDYSTMKAGREIDALVAELMGYKITHRGHRVVRPDGKEISGFLGTKDCRNYIAGDCPAYSTDISAAWQVMEKIGTNGVAIINDDAGNWCVSRDGMQPVEREEGKPFWSTWIIDEDTPWAPNVPLAICRAALMALDT